MICPAFLLPALKDRGSVTQPGGSESPKHDSGTAERLKSGWPLPAHPVGAPQTLQAVLFAMSDLLRVWPGPGLFTQRRDHLCARDPTSLRRRTSCRTQA